MPSVILVWVIARDVRASCGRVADVHGRRRRVPQDVLFSPAVLQGLGQQFLDLDDGNLHAGDFEQRCRATAQRMEGKAIGYVVLRVGVCCPGPLQFLCEGQRVSQILWRLRWSQLQRPDNIDDRMCYVHIVQGVPIAATAPLLAGALRQRSRGMFTEITPEQSQRLLAASGAVPVMVDAAVDITTTAVNLPWPMLCLLLAMLG